jgi:hypothetical protein
MIETLINNSALIQLIATIVNAIAIVVLVIVTWTYTKATKGMADTMYKQFVYENKPYLSIKYHQKESNSAPVLEFKNNSEKSRINVRYDLFLVPPEKAVRLELKNPETIEKLKMLWPSEDIIIEPGEIYPLNLSIIIQEGLIEIGVDIEKNYIYGIVIKGHYTPDIPDIGSFPILEYWQVVRHTELNAWSIIPNKFF